MKTALVTGRDGFVARHLIKKLSGYSVLGTEDLGDFIRQHPQSFDLVVHLAANIENVDARMRGGVGMYQDTVLDYAMAEYLEKHPPRECAVWMTSCAVDYPDDPYAWVKLNGEKLAAALHRRGVPIAILRPYSGYGGNQAQGYPFPAILGRAMRREDPLTVWGSGKQVRDWVHIDDLTDAIMWAIKDAPKGIPVPIGTGVGTDFLTLARMMAKAAGYEPEIKPLPQKAESSPRRVCDTTLARMHGWKATISLEEGIRRAVGEHESLQVLQGRGAEVSRCEVLPGSSGERPHPRSSASGTPAADVWRD